MNSRMKIPEPHLPDGPRARTKRSKNESELAEDSYSDSASNAVASSLPFLRLWFHRHFLNDLRKFCTTSRNSSLPFTP